MKNSGTYSVLSIKVSVTNNALCQFIIFIHFYCAREKIRKMFCSIYFSNILVLMIFCEKKLVQIFEKVNARVKKRAQNRFHESENFEQFGETSKST